MNPRVWNWIEWGAVSLALAVLAIWLGQHVCFFASSSLWTDEIVTIQAFISGGPGESLSTYTSNNHMLFSFLNSILPGADSFEPLRARFLSLLAVVIGVIVSAIFFIKRGWRLEALLVAVCSVGASSLLQLNLQARGYGFMFLASVIVSIALLRYLENGKRADLIWFSAAVFCGGWSTPSFLFWAGPLMVIVAAWRFFRRERWLEVLIAGVIVLAVTIIAYLPAIDYYSDEEAVESMFGAAKPFGEWRAIPRVVWEYLTTQSAQIIRQFVIPAFIVLGAVIILPIAKIQITKPVWQATLLATVGVIVFFLICRVLEKPFIRTAAFIVVPIGFAIAYGIRNLDLSDTIKRVSTVAVSILIILAWLPQIFALQLLPKEAWRECAQLARQIIPDKIDSAHTKIRNNDYFQLYSASSLKPAEHFDESAFNAGRQLLVEANFYEPPENRLNFLGKIDNVVQLDLPQGRGVEDESRWMRIAFVAPHQNGFSEFTLAHQPGAISKQTFQIDAVVGANGIQQLLMFSPALKISKPPRLKISRGEDSWKTLEIDGERIGDLWIYPVDLDPETVIKLSYYIEAPADEIEGFSMWGK